MEHDPPPNIPEDYKIRAKIFVETEEISVTCKIFLPKSILEKPQVYIFPTKEQFHRLPSLRGRYKVMATLGKPPETEIIFENTYISGGSLRHWEEGLEEGYLKLYPTRLIIRHLNISSANNYIWFKLSPSKLLAPWDIREYDFDGIAKIKYGKSLHFDLASDFSINLKNYYKWEGTQDKKTLTYSELIAEAKFKKILKEAKIEYCLSTLDDFLLLVSLAEGQKCTIPQLTIFFPDRFEDIFRLDRALPRISPTLDHNDFLIDESHIEIFLKTAWESYKNSKQQKLIKSALETNTNDSQIPMESKFLSLFSSLETLILAFRLDNNKEYILSNLKEWKDLSGEIKRIIRESPILKDKNSRALMYQNINGINRIPLQYVINNFLEEKQIKLEDLWPLSGLGRGYSLTKIRNRLVHGYGLYENFINSFGLALENLEYYAKRMLLITLGWDFKESSLFRKDEKFIELWKEAMVEISNWK